MTDDDRDAMFLVNHRGWSWQDMQNAPALVIDAIRHVGRERA